MKRFTLVPVLWVSLCFCTAAANAEDYLLKLEAIEYVGVPDEGIEAEGRVLYSIEVVTQPRAVFHSKVSIDSQTLTLTGRLRPSDRGGFSVQMDFVDSKDSGITITKEDGTREPLPHITSFMTTVGVGLDERVRVSGIGTRTKKPGEPPREFRVWYVLSLVLFDST